MSIHAYVSNLHRVALRVTALGNIDISNREQFIVLNAKTAEEAVAQCRRIIEESQPGWEFGDSGVEPVGEIELLSVVPISEEVGPPVLKYENVVICRPFLNAPLFMPAVEPENARCICGEPRPCPHVDCRHVDKPKRAEQGIERLAQMLATMLDFSLRWCEGRYGLVPTVNGEEDGPPQFEGTLSACLIELAKTLQEDRGL